MMEYIDAPKWIYREATISLYAPALDKHLLKIKEMDDRVFCFYEKDKTPGRSHAKAFLKRMEPESSERILTLIGRGRGKPGR
jgi:hypothetical protein